MNTVKSTVADVKDYQKDLRKKYKKRDSYETELKNQESLVNLERFLHEELQQRYNVTIDLIEEPLNPDQWAKRIIEQNHAESVFTTVDLGRLIYQAMLWKRYLPRIQPFYAVKSNPDLNILRSLMILGVNFDCASKGEIQQILELGGDPSQIIYANPAKGFEHINYAKEKDVRLMTFDNLLNLTKL
jgi:ornithine decarboxylase